MLEEAPNRSIQVTESLFYRDLPAILARASVYVTDSGGIQKEALRMTVPCVTVRTRPNGSRRCGRARTHWRHRVSDIAASVARSLRKGDRDYSNPYGDGRASERSVRVMKELIGPGTSR